MTQPRLLPSVLMIDGEERVRSFLAEHGGAAPQREREGEFDNGLSGWSEVYAADGHILRCDWRFDGTTTHMRFSEMAPGRDGAPS